MKVKILAFGIAKDVIGETSFELDAGNKLTVAELKRGLLGDYPSLPGFMVAVNTVYAKDDQLIEPGDVVAIIPPTNGG